MSDTISALLYCDLCHENIGRIEKIDLISINTVRADLRRIIITHRETEEHKAKEGQR